MSVAQRIQGIVAGQRWLGDGAPTWEGARTSDWASVEQATLVARLNRFGDEFEGAAALAEKIASCRKGQRCASGADPVCTRAMCRWFTCNTRRLVTRHGGSWYAFCIV